MPAYLESYEQAIEFLYRRINYERISGAAYSADDFKPDRLREFLARLGNPQERIPTVHIAGTKGKGSTAAMIASALTACGYRTGLFTSPHISAFEERMAVDGVLPSPAQIVELVNAVYEAVIAFDELPGEMGPTYFEIATAMAWLFFERAGVQIAVLEVGLGGRLDATNICHPEVCIITTISRDHTRQLGSRLEQIAREKAGIVKPGVAVITGVDAPQAFNAIAEICRDCDAPLDQLGRDFTYDYHRTDQKTQVAGVDQRETPEPNDVAGSSKAEAINSVDVITRQHEWRNVPVTLIGEHQARNTALAIAAIERLRERSWNLPEELVRRGLSRVQWPGRIEVLRRRPTVIVDAAHNWAAIAALLKTLDESFPARRRVLVFAATKDKDVSGMLRQLLPRFDTVVLTCYQNNPRALSVEELARMAATITSVPFHVAPDPASAWKLAEHFATPDDLICVTGSFFIAAELRELILGQENAPRSHGDTEKTTLSVRSLR